MSCALFSTHKKLFLQCHLKIYIYIYIYYALGDIVPNTISVG